MNYLYDSMAVIAKFLSYIRVYFTLLIGGCIHSLEVDINSEFTFDIFVSVAVLMTVRASIMKATDATEVFSCLNK